ncbi:hypothetical protein AB1N83_008887 [Pleurotus pulmonarius]
MVLSWLGQAKGHAGGDVATAYTPVLGGHDNTRGTDVGRGNFQLSAAQQSSLVCPAQFSRVAYCSSAAVTSWSCGPPCDDIGKGVEVIQAGGDDGLVPIYFVAHDPIAESIILLKGLNSTRFPSADDSVKVHDGFRKTFERTADGVLSGVQKGLAANNVNKEWANFVDQTLGSSLTHVTNQDDPAPSSHPGSSDIVVCAGQQNENCSEGNNILFDHSVANHAGPYIDNISFGGDAFPL